MNTFHTLDNAVFLEDQKLAVIHRSGSVQMMPGKKPYREAVLAYLQENPAEPEAQEEAPAPAKHQPSVAKEPPAGTPEMGDKDPAVVAWWFEHRPEEARARYAGRTFPTKHLYFTPHTK